MHTLGLRLTAPRGIPTFIVSAISCFELHLSQFLPYLTFPHAKSLHLLLYSRIGFYAHLLNIRAEWRAPAKKCRGQQQCPAVAPSTAETILSPDTDRYSSSPPARYASRTW